MDCDMVCNYKKCRKRMSTFAWVTSCSHIFCDEDGAREFNKSYTCPACESNLSGKLDIVRIDLSPSEQYKSMVLAGQRPEVVMEVCTRAIAFWTYQIHQERVFQDYTMNKSKDRQTQMEKYYEQLVSRTQNDLGTLKSQISSTRKELESSEKRLNEVSGKLMERNRQYQKLQSMYDSIRRRSISLNSLASSGQGSFSSQAHPVKGHEIRNFESEGHSHARQSPAQREFVLRPSSTAMVSASPSSSNIAIQDRFNMQIGTPKESTASISMQNRHK